MKLSLKFHFDVRRKINIQNIFILFSEFSLWNLACGKCRILLNLFMGISCQSKKYFSIIMKSVVWCLWFMGSETYHFFLSINVFNNVFEVYPFWLRISTHEIQIGIWCSQRSFAEFIFFTEMEKFSFQNEANVS